VAVFDKGHNYSDSAQHLDIVNAAVPAPLRIGISFDAYQIVILLYRAAIVAQPVYRLRLNLD
jgi:hypothetical protein